MLETELENEIKLVNYEVKVSFFQVVKIVACLRI